MEIRRIFDIIDLNYEKYPRNDMYGGKQGLAQAGMIHVPIYPTISTDEYGFILEHSDVKAIILRFKGLRV